jgi:hypothetical protein
MGETCFVGIFIASTYIVHNIHHRHGRSWIFMNYHPEAIGKRKLLEMYHSYDFYLQSA